MARADIVEENPETGWSDWMKIDRRERFICCSCALAHDHEYEVRKGKLYVRIRENRRSTANARRALKKKKK